MWKELIHYLGRYLAALRSRLLEIHEKNRNGLVGEHPYFDKKDASRLEFLAKKRRHLVDGDKRVAECRNRLSSWAGRAIACFALLIYTGTNDPKGLGVTVATFAALLCGIMALIWVVRELKRSAEIDAEFGKLHGREWNTLQEQKSYGEGDHHRNPAWRLPEDRVFRERKKKK